VGNKKKQPSKPPTKKWRNKPFVGRFFEKKKNIPQKRRSIAKAKFENEEKWLNSRLSVERRKSAAINGEGKSKHHIYDGTQLVVNKLVYCGLVKPYEHENSFQEIPYLKKDGLLELMYVRKLIFPDELKMLKNSSADLHQLIEKCYEKRMIEDNQQEEENQQQEACIFELGTFQDFMLEREKNINSNNGLMMSF